jgi:hypothetical protein
VILRVYESSAPCARWNQMNTWPLRLLRSLRQPTFYPPGAMKPVNSTNPLRGDPDPDPAISLRLTMPTIPLTAAWMMSRSDLTRISCRRRILAATNRLEDPSRRQSGCLSLMSKDASCTLGKGRYSQCRGRKNCLNVKSIAEGTLIKPYHRTGDIVYLNAEALGWDWRVHSCRS